MSDTAFLRHPASGRVVVDRGDTRTGLITHYGAVEDATAEDWSAQCEADQAAHVVRPVDLGLDELRPEPPTEEQVAALVIRSTASPAPPPVTTDAAPAGQIGNRRARR